MSENSGGYSNIKIPLHYILKDDVDYFNLYDAISRANQLTINVRFFIKCYLLYLFDQGSELPLITEEFVRVVYKVLSVDASRARALTSENGLIYNSLVKFRDEVFANTSMYSLVNGFGLDSIIGYETTSYVTNMNNGLTQNYMKKIKYFVNKTIKKFHNILIDNVREDFSKKDLEIYKKQLNKELIQVRSDFINNDDKFASPKTYHKWILNYRKIFFPQEYEISYAYDVAVNPQKYIKYMITLNRLLEYRGWKRFECFPLRHSVIEKSVKIDTSTIVKLFIKTKYKVETKQKYLDNIMNYREYIWKRFFRATKPIFKRNNYIFDYTITTNGYEASISFLYVDNYKKKEQEKGRMSKGRRQGKIDRANGIIKEKKVPIEKKQIKKTRTVKDLSKPKPKDAEFKYIHELNEQELAEVKKGKLVYADPGKIRILTMIDDNDVVFKYSCSQRLKETKREEYQSKRERYSKENGIKEIEEILCDYTSKTFYLDKFIEYVSVKNIVYNSTKDKYNDDLYKKLLWYGHINKQRSEERLIQNIKAKYGEDAIIIIGDWSETMPIKRISTPGIGMRRLLAKHFKVYLIDEYNTSKLNHITEKPCENLEIESKSIHSVLTYEMSNGRKGCINRDINAVKNMRKIVHSILLGKGRPENYKRKPKKEETESEIQIDKKIIEVQIEEETKEKEIINEPKKKGKITIKKKIGTLKPKNVKSYQVPLGRNQIAISHEAKV